MKIKKVYIKNFKGIKNKQVIDFDKDITFLTGPNGFGKTTIFDAIELCLTGQIHRIIKNEGVTNDTKDYLKPFFQNADGDVIIKLLIEREDSERPELVIVKHFDSVNLPIYKEKKYKVRNIAKDLKTYKESVDDFYKDTFIPSSASNLTQDEINLFFGLENEKLINLYPLYNYLQQEETTYFLKKTEIERKNDFNFLFKTEEEVELKNKVKNFYENIKLLYSDLLIIYNERKAEFDSKKQKIVMESEVNHFFFFDKDILSTFETLFDKENPFSDISAKDADKKNSELNSNLNNLRNFLHSVDVNEYKKLEFKNKLEKLEEDRLFIQSYILQNFLEKDKYKQLEKLNSIYESSKNSEYVDYLVFESLLSDEKKFLELKEKSFIYELTFKNDNLFKKLILEDLINDENFLNEGIRNQQLRNILSDNINIDIFLLGKFRNEYSSLKKEYDNYNLLVSNKKTFDLLLLRNFYLREDNNKSKFEFLRDINAKIARLESFRLLVNFNEKISQFPEVYKLLGLTSDTLKQFNSLFLRKNDLEKDVSVSVKVISNLNEIRKGLIDFYKIHNISEKISRFDNRCLLCGTSSVGKSNIEDFQTFENLVITRTKEIEMVTSSKNEELEKINEGINTIIHYLYGEIDAFISNNKNHVFLYEKLHGIATQEDFDSYEQYLYNFLDKKLENECYPINEEKFGDYELKRDKLSTDLLKQYIYGFRLFPYVDKIVSSENKIADLETLKILPDTNNVKYNITKDGFNSDNYLYIKNSINDAISNTIKDFNFGLYNYVKEVKFTDTKEDFSANIHQIQFFLGEELDSYKYDPQKDLYVSNLDTKKERLLMHLREKTIFHSLLVNKLNEITSYSSSLDRDAINNLKQFLRANKIPFQIQDELEYSDTLVKNIYETIRKEMLLLLTDKIEIFKDLRHIKNNSTIENLKNNVSFLNSLESSEFRKYILVNEGDYKNIQNNYKSIKELITKESNKIIIDEKRLGGDLQKMFSSIFKGDYDLLDKYKAKKSLLDHKQKYISYKFYELYNSELEIESLKLKIIEERLEKLFNIVENSEKLKKCYEEGIKSYIANMIKKIQTPFFIYTAKIIQNYQQGMGIFIVFEGNQSIRFYSDSDSSHDAIHHLSSGQLAVVSIAFTLAINSAFNISNYLKFINIDDPIQEMDSLNIHSFIELMRHSFMDYKLILSTHSDENAYFMKYKIEKIKGENTVNLFNVQNKFFPSGNANVLSEELKDSDTRKMKEHE